MQVASVLILFIVVLVIILVPLAVRIVPQGMEYTVERWGRYTHTLEPGFHLIIPIFDRIGSRLSMMEQVLDVPSQEIITKDNAMVRVDGILFYQVLNAAKAAYEVSHLEYAVRNLTMTNIRTVMGSMDLDELLSRRDEINNRLLAVVDEATNPWGIKVTRIEIKDITPPKDLVDSMARQMKAERDKRADILEAEGVRQADILKAEGQKQASILRAEGMKQSAILEAEGRREAAFREAEARERLAQAEARATAMLSKAIEEGNTQSVNYFIAQKYLEAFGKLAESPNQKVLMLPMEATGILGSLAGMAELLKEGGFASAKSDRKEG
ncbi:MAG: SPFH/Band 7/PHB domain protein [Magnetococcales bacterium]|nr:SPFH/Band 7/PHB domain protein [Magnetococcales bacterium]NGZ26423.1 SPFH/Band 7/PHB domain protein [Magnetococcales bacterium]